MLRSSGLSASPDEQNAFTLVRRANQKFTPMPLNLNVGDPRVHDWFEANRPLVDLFIQAAECADGISGPEDVDNGRYYPIESNWGGTLFAMTYMEGGRRADSGNMAGAWDCYRAILRMYVHLRRRERLNDSPACRSPSRRTTAASGEMGGGSQDHDSPASTRPGGGGRVPAEARVGCVHTQAWSISISCNSWTDRSIPLPSRSRRS